MLDSGLNYIAVLVFIAKTVIHSNKHSQKILILKNHSFMVFFQIGL